MKQLLSASLLAFTVAMPAMAQESKQDFTMVNRTGYELRELYVSPSASDDWQNDVLGRSSLPDGSSVDVKFQRATKTCMWDLKVVYTDDGSNAVWHNVDLCKIEKITIKYNRSTDTTSASFD